jgi:hypothetical protein
MNPKYDLSSKSFLIPKKSWKYVPQFYPTFPAVWTPITNHSLSIFIKIGDPL